MNTPYSVSSPIQAPDRTNDRNLSDILKEFPSFDILFVQSLKEKIGNPDLTNPINVLEIGCGQGNTLEDIKKLGEEKTNCYGLSKYIEWENKNGALNGSYHQFEIQDSLPSQIPDNSVDYIYSFYSLQYIEQLFHTIQSIHHKLKINGKAFLNLGLISSIDSILLREFLEKDINNQLSTFLIKSNGQLVLVIEKKVSNTLFIPLYKNKSWSSEIPDNLFGILARDWKQSKILHETLSDKLLPKIITDANSLGYTYTNIRNFGYLRVSPQHA